MDAPNSGENGNTSNSRSELDDHTLSHLFGKCYRIFEEVRDSSESQNSESFQSKVAEVILLAEKLTDTVSRASLFAANESADELPADTLKFLLLPFILAEMTAKLVGSDSLQRVERADVYYRDFLQRLVDYELIESATLAALPPLTASLSPPPPPRPTVDLQLLQQQRQQRIDRYQQHKQLKQQLDLLTPLLSEGGESAGGGGAAADEATTRLFHCTLLRYSALLAVDSVNSLTAERHILLHKQQQQQQQETSDSVAGSTVSRTCRTGAGAAAGGAGLGSAVLLTRGSLQARVFGAGYSSLPSMSVEDFYRSRVADGTFISPAQLAEKAREQKTHSNSHQQQSDQPSADDLRAEQKERAEERDDETELARARQWDEFTDQCRRGEGNRHNRS